MVKASKIKTGLRPSGRLGMVRRNVGGLGKTHRNRSKEDCGSLTPIRSERQVNTCKKLQR